MSCPRCRPRGGEVRAERRSTIRDTIDFDWTAGLMQHQGWNDHPIPSGLQGALHAFCCECTWSMAVAVGFSPPL